MPAHLTIDAVGADGDGIAQTAHGSVYVPFTLPGERVLAQVDGGRGALIEVLEPSPARIAPVCPHFGVCGGCALQHMHADIYAEWKRERVIEALAARGLHPDVDPVWRAPLSSRRRAMMTARRDGDAISLGFHKRLSHDVVDMQVCAVLDPRIVGALPRLRRLLSPLVHPGHNARLTVLSCGNGLDVHIQPDRKPSAGDLVKASRVAADIDGLVRLTILNEEVFRPTAPSLAIGDVILTPPPGAFVQAVGAAEHELARLAVEGVGKAKTVADLFCGLGAFTFRLARRARVTAAENDDGLLAALAAGARDAGGLKPIVTLRRDLDREPLSAMELNRFDAVVFDPPRNGAFAQSEEIARSKLKCVVAISCNPASFSRDARVLVDAGFMIAKVAPVDQFLFSPHVELAAWFRR